jgi:hypothetical protein
MDSDRLLFAALVIRRSGAFLYAALVLTSLLAVVTLVLTRFLQLHLVPQFNQYWDTVVDCYDDLWGFAFASTGAVVLVIILYLSLAYPRIKRRVLAEMGRCGHCGYPSTPGRPCSECGYSPPVRGR